MCLCLLVFGNVRKDACLTEVKVAFSTIDGVVHNNIQNIKILSHDSGSSGLELQLRREWLYRSN